MHIGDNIEEDKKFKKLIANLNIGLLEKSQNTVSTCTVFNTESEARHFQLKYGGTIHSIQEVEEIVGHDQPYFSKLDKGIVMDEWNDCGDEDELRINQFQNYNNVRTGKEYFILRIADTASLLNGFRYVKELLLQEHNFQMYEAQLRLSEHSIRIYSVKTDAITIRASDMESVRRLLIFVNNLGTWRVSKEAVIIYPTQKLDNQSARNHHLVPVSPLVVRQLEVPDEYDNEHICQLIHPAQKGYCQS